MAASQNAREGIDLGISGMAIGSSRHTLSRGNPPPTHPPPVVLRPRISSFPRRRLESSRLESLNDLLAPIQAEFRASPEWQAVAEQAYPTEKPVAKPKKQPKDKGDPAKKAAALAARQAAQAQKEGGAGADAAQEGVKKLSVAEN